MSGAARRAAALAVSALVAATLPAAGQEQVRIRVPDDVTFDLDLAERVTAPPSRVGFDHALLAPGSRLRISVRAEGLELPPGGAVRLSFRPLAARCGVAWSGTPTEAGYTPVFESFPLALAGGVDLEWTLEPLGRFERAGAHSVTLQWKLEAIPGGEAPVGGVVSPRLSPPPRSVAPLGERPGRRPTAPGRADRSPGGEPPSAP